MIIITAEAVAVHNQLEKLGHMLASLQVVVELLELQQVSNYLLELPQALEQELLLLVE
jgi:hypothetical protein